jgi:WD40 repeat protein
MLITFIFYYDVQSDFYQAETEEKKPHLQDLIITGSLDSLAKAWFVHTGKCAHTFRGHQSAVTCMVTDEPKKNPFTGSADHNIISWDIHSAQVLKQSLVIKIPSFIYL